MKRVIFLLFLWPCFVFAQVGLEFRSVAIPDLVEGVIRGVLKRDYVLSPEVLTNQQRVTMHVREVEPSRVLAVLQGVVSSAGVAIEDRGGVLYVESRKNASALPPDVAGAPGVQPPGIAGAFPHGAIPGQLPGYPNQFGLGQQQFAGMPGVTPEELSFYRPRGKSVEFLSSIARVAGAYVPDMKAGKADVVVFGGKKETVDKIRKLFEEVDSPVQSVSIKAALVEFTDSDNSSRSFSVALDALGGKLGVNYKAGDALANSITWKVPALSMVLSAIDGDSRFKFIAEPSLAVMDGESARFVVGSEVPTRGTSQVDKNGNPVSSIEYRTAGVLVTVEPKIIRDRVHVKVGQQVSTFALNTTSNIDSPTILKREAETSVSVDDGELIVIAGMDESRETSSSSGLAFLPDFLRSKDSQRQRSQMLLMLEVRRKPQAI